MVYFDKQMGFVFTSKIFKTKKWIDIQSMPPSLNSFKNSITFFEFNTELNLWKYAEEINSHNPSFMIEFTVLNWYNHIVIHS